MRTGFGFGAAVVACAVLALPAVAQVGNADASVRCVAVAEELARVHDQGVAVYNTRNAAYNANPNPDEAKRLDGMVVFLGKMAEASAEVLVYYSKVEVPQAIRDELKAKKPGELMALARACVDAEKSRIAKAQ